MTEREQRGLLIAATVKITRRDGVWLVRSGRGNGRYIVTPDGDTPRCTCPDYETRGGKCKHIHAVELVSRREASVGDEGEAPAEEVAPVRRQTYRQNWTRYNAAQTNEKNTFLFLLHDLCSGLVGRPQAKGRRRLPLSDAVFAACFKVYSTVSSRRFMCDLQEAQEKGLIDRAPHFNSVLNALDNPEVGVALRSLITQSSLPLRAVEVDFAADSSGFTTSRFTRWYDHKYGVTRKGHDWVKAHVMCGVKTNVVTAVEILERNTNDSKVLPDLVVGTAANFTMREVSADKQYASLNNYDVIERAGAMPFIPFRPNHRGHGGGLWAKMYHFYCYRRDEFLAHYHKRSNAETTFAMIKAKFGDHVRSRTDLAMRNEVLAKILCHNICCLIHESYELGTDQMLAGAIPAALPA